MLHCSVSFNPCKTCISHPSSLPVPLDSLKDWRKVQKHSSLSCPLSASLLLPKNQCKTYVGVVWYEDQLVMLDHLCYSQQLSLQLKNILILMQHLGYLLLFLSVQVNCTFLQTLCSSSKKFPPGHFLSYTLSQDPLLIILVFFDFHRMHQSWMCVLV